VCEGKRAFEEEERHERRQHRKNDTGTQKFLSEKPHGWQRLQKIGGKPFLGRKVFRGLAWAGDGPEGLVPAEEKGILARFLSGHP